MSLIEPWSDDILFPRPASEFSEGEEMIIQAYK